MIEVKAVPTMFDRPKPELPGKTHGKDIVLLCKGWYNKDKYKTRKDAFQQYYEERYSGGPYEQLSYGFINQVLLRPAIEEILSERFKMMFIDFIFDSRRSFSLFNKQNVEYEESLYYRLTSFLDANLKCIEDDDTVLINTDDYYLKDEEGNRVERDGHKVLAEPIIKD